MSTLPPPPAVTQPTDSWILNAALNGIVSTFAVLLALHVVERVTGQRPRFGRR